MSLKIDLLETQQGFISELESSGKSFNTLKNYRADLRCFNNYLLNKKRDLYLNDFSLAEAKEYSFYLTQKYTASNSIRRRIQALRLYFDFLVRDHGYPHNPIKRIPVSPKVLEKPHPTPYEEILKVKKFLLERLNSTTHLESLLVRRNLLVLYLIYETGIKVSDLANLKKRDILFSQKNTIRVMISSPKREPYSIEIPEQYREYIQDYLARYNEAMEKMNLELDDLFFNANPYKILSGGLSSRGTELVFEEIRKQIKTQMTARNLRQSAIFKWISEQIPANLIKERLGVAPDYDLRPYLETYEKSPQDFQYFSLINL